MSFTLQQRLVNSYWPQSGERGRPVVKHKTVSVMGVWQKRIEGRRKGTGRVMGTNLAPREGSDSKLDPYLA